MTDTLAELLQARLDSQAARRIPRRSEGSGPARLAPAQLGMWLIWQQDPLNTAYNVALPLRLRGPLNTEVLLAGVREVVRRHEILRTTYTNEPRAAVGPVDAVPIGWSDETDPQRIVREMISRPFRLDREPPMRAALHRLGADDHVLALSFHHIALDAWGSTVLLEELSALYAGHQLEPVPCQYADYAEWLLDRPAEPDLQWWKDRLEGVPAVLDIPADHPRTPGDQNAAEVQLTLPDGVREFAYAHQCSPFMVLLTALQVLLARLTATTDIAVGVPEAGRSHEDTEAMIGSCLNTLVIRQDVDPERTVAQLLAANRVAVLDAFSHAQAPFTSVVDRLRPARTPGVTPLFQVLLNVVQTPIPRFPGLEASLLPVAATSAKFDLSWNIADHGALGLAGSLVYRSGLFEPATAQCFAAWLGNVLAGVLADPGALVGDIALEPDRGPILCGPRRAIPTAVPLHTAIERVVDRCPQSVAVVAADGSLTYSELDRRANQVAHYLLAAGVRPGEPVGVIAARRTHLMVLLLGVLKAGAAHAALDPDWPADRIAAMCADLRLVLTDPQVGRAMPATRPGVAVSPDQLAYLIYTSGSTGRPKGVAVEHRQITHYLQAAFEHMPPVAGGSFALASTIAADLGLTNVYGALAASGTLHLIDRETAADPIAMARHRVDVLKCVPSHLEMLAAHGDLAAVLPHRLLLLAGEPCPWDLVRRIRAVRPDLAIQNSYGPCETTVATFMCDVDTVPPSQREGVVPLGVPLANVDCWVVDPRGRPLPRGVPGDLVIGGPTVARGYLGADGSGAFLSSPPQSSAGPSHTTGRCYRTGDRVRVRLDGTVEFQGRLDDQIKIRGFRVELGEVGAALRTAPGVAEAFALPVGQSHGRRLVAWVTPSNVDVAAVREALRKRLPEYMVPSQIITLERLPLNANGKVDRSALPSPSDRSAGHEPPATPTQRRIAAAWREVLNVAEIGLDDDFFALGADSFQAVRAVRALGSGLRVIDLFTYPTVRELSRCLESASQEAAGLLHNLGGSAGVRTVICIPYGGGSAAAYRPLANALGSQVTTLAVELPGHDPARPDEDMLGLPDTVHALAAEIAESVTGPVVVYGHCVGTALAVALAQRLEADGRIVERVVLGASFPFARLPGKISGWIARWLPSDRLTSDRAYRDQLRVLGGLEELDAEQADVMLRSLRHDAREAETWFGAQLGKPTRLRAPIVCVVGERDRSTELYQERYREWGAFSDRISLMTVPHAGHYFLKHQAAYAAAAIDAPAPEPAPASVAPTADSGKRIEIGLRPFYTVAFGQTMSLVGSALSTFALGVWAYQRTGRISDYALIAMLAVLPAIAFAPLGGAIADRFDRRRVMLACDAVCAVTMLALVALVWSGTLTLWEVAVVAGITATVTAVHRPAYLAAVTQLVPKAYLGQANALVQLGTGVGMLLAPMAGGALMVAIGLRWVVGLDVLTFLIGLSTLLVVRFPDRLHRRRDETFRQAIAGGLRYIVRRRPLMVMTLYFILVNYLETVALVICTPLVLALGSAADLGAVTTASGIGAVTGSILMIIYGGTRRKAIGMVGFVISMGIGIALMGVRPSILLVGAGAVLWWASLSIVNAHWISMIQLKSGPELQGRVLATNQMLAIAMTPLAYFTAPALAAAIGSMSTLLLFTGLILAVWGVAGLLYRPLRLMEDGLPDAVPDAEIGDLDTVQARADARLAAAR